MIDIYETINKAIEFAKKAEKKTAIASFYQEHDEKKVVEELAKHGWRASVRRCYDNMDPNRIAIEYEIEL